MLSSEHVKTIQFDRTRRAYCFFTTENTTPQDIISEFHLDPLPKGFICISGGATKFPSNTVKKITRLTESSIAPLVYDYDLLIIDGGTDSGVMQITGKVLRKVKYSHHSTQDESQIQASNFENFPLMGFVPEARVNYPGAKPSPQREVELESNHTYFVLVREAQDWGKEVERMFEFINYLVDTKHLPIVHIIANGGRITIKEAYHSVKQGRHIIILEGSERATEVIIAMLDGVSKKELIDLFKKHKIAKQADEVKETLAWLNEIAKYDNITRFVLSSGSPDELREIILSNLGLRKAEKTISV